VVGKNRSLCGKGGGGWVRSGPKQGEGNHSCLVLSLNPLDPEGFPLFGSGHLNVGGGRSWSKRFKYLTDDAAPKNYRGELEYAGSPPRKERRGADQTQSLPRGKRRTEGTLHPGRKYLSILEDAKVENTELSGNKLKKICIRKEATVT